MFVSPLKDDQLWLPLSTGTMHPWTICRHRLYSLKCSSISSIEEEGRGIKRKKKTLEAVSSGEVSVAHTNTHQERLQHHHRVSPPELDASEPAGKVADPKPIHVTEHCFSLYKRLPAENLWERESIKTESESSSIPGSQLHVLSLIINKTCPWLKQLTD